MIYNYKSAHHYKICFQAYLSNRNPNQAKDMAQKTFII